MKHTLRMTLAAAVSLVAMDAMAGGFAVREQSAYWQGTSFAGAATSGGGLSGMFWNPAVITQVPGINVESHAAAIFGYAAFTPSVVGGFTSGPAVATRGPSGNIAQPAAVPASYASYQINDRLFAGVSINSPFGLRTKSDFAWAGQLYGRSTKAFNVMVTPTLGYRVNDWLSVAAGVQVSYFSARLAGATGVGPTANSAILSGDSWGVGYTLGATITPMAGTEIGIGFRSSVHHELSGDIEGIAPAKVPIKAKLNLPEIVTLGLRQKVGQDFTVLAGLEWSNWSRLGTPAIMSTATGTQVSKLPFEYGDGWMVSLGGEYRVNQQWTARAGLAYEWSPVSDRVRSVRIPDNDRIWASLGATYNWNEKISFDASYTHIFTQNVDVKIVNGNPHFVNPFVQLAAKGKAHVDIISLSLRYRWDTPVAPARAIVTKG